MNQTKLYIIRWKDGSEQEEYGDSEVDIRDFLNRCYPHKGEPESIDLHPNYVEN